MPQTLKNLDKAVSKVVLASGENLEARIRGNTAKTEARGQITLDGMFRTEDERRKIENRAATTRIAIEEIEINPETEDATSEIEDDWLNIFARIAEDKSSEELQILFGRILAGEVKRPGSFSLRTLQVLATLSKRDAERLSALLSFAVDGMIIPFLTAKDDRPFAQERLFLEEIGVAGHPSQVGGMSLIRQVDANSHRIIQMAKKAVVIINETDKGIEFRIPGQPLVSTGTELIKIANPPETGADFISALGESVLASLKNSYGEAVNAGTIKVQIAHQIADYGTQVEYSVIRTLNVT
jgi:hypothetical protein